MYHYKPEFRVININSLNLAPGGGPDPLTVKITTTYVYI
jgi:hypothetical protein